MSLFCSEGVAWNAVWGGVYVHGALCAWGTVRVGHCGVGHCGVGHMYDLYIAVSGLPRPMGECLRPPTVDCYELLMTAS